MGDGYLLPEERGFHIREATLRRGMRLLDRIGEGSDDFSEMTSQPIEITIFPFVTSRGSQKSN